MQFIIHERSSMNTIQINEIDLESPPNKTYSGTNEHVINSTKENQDSKKHKNSVQCLLLGREKRNTEINLI